MAKGTIWYTRCPVPTASGIAYQRRAFSELLGGDHEVRNIKELGKAQIDTHLRHNLPFAGVAMTLLRSRMIMP